MTRPAFIVDALTPDERATLERKLARILPPGDRASFLGAVGEAIDEYRKCYAPAERDADLRAHKLDALMRVAEAFERATTKLDVDTRQELERDLWIAAGRPEPRPQFAPIDTARIEV